MTAGGAWLWRSTEIERRARIFPNRNLSAFAAYIDRTGRTIAHRGLTGRVELITADGRCVVLRESGKERPERDLVGRDLRLNEVWRLRNVDRVGLAWANTDSRALSRGLLVQDYERKIRTSRLPVCAPPILNRQ
jgi:hypothetical protein